MTDEESLQIRQLIKEEVEAGIKDRFRPLLEKLDSIQNSLDLGFGQLDEDRKDFAEVKTSQATVERLLKELLDIYTNQSKRLEKKIDDKATNTIESAAQAVADSVEPVMASIAKKLRNNKPLSDTPSKKWYHFWRR